MTAIGPARAGLGLGVTFLVVVLAAIRPFGPVGMAVVISLLLGLALVVAGWPSGPKSVPAPMVRVPPANLKKSLEQRWTTATGQHDDVLTAYAAYELDPAMLLRYPAMWDLTAPPVINFHDALDLAGSLRSDRYPGDHAATEYLGAVTMLRSDWAAADRYARSTGTDGLSDTDAGECRRALNLWQHAQGAAGPERATYLEKVVGSLDKLSERGAVTAPDPIRENLNRQVQRALES